MLSCLGFTLAFIATGILLIDEFLFSYFSNRPLLSREPNRLFKTLYFFENGSAWKTFSEEEEKFVKSKNENEYSNTILIDHIVL